MGPWGLLTLSKELILLFHAKDQCHVMVVAIAVCALTQSGSDVFTPEYFQIQCSNSALFKGPNTVILRKIIKVQPLFMVYAIPSRNI